MSTSQERVYDLLDTVSKPIQWFIGGVQLLLWAIAGTLFLIAVPIYYLVHGQPVTGDMFINAGLAVFALFTFFVAPWYFVVGGILSTAAFAMYLDTPEHMQTALRVTHSANGFKLCIFLWLLVGVAQAFIRWQSRRSHKNLCESYRLDTVNKYRAELGLPLFTKETLPRV